MNDSDRIYLDHNATCPVRPWVRDLLFDLLHDASGNPSSVHAEGRAARARIERARRSVRASLGRDDGTVVFTSGATEANHLALRSIAAAERLVLSRLDHPSIVAAVSARSERGPTVDWIEVDEAATWDWDALADALREDTTMIASVANNELGVCTDIERLAGLCEQRGARLHLDAAQWVGRWPFTIPRGVTSLTFSGHKAGGLSGVGGLWVAGSQRILPLEVGGSQERGRRPGTENVLGIAVLGDVVQARESHAWGALRRVRDAMEAALEAGGARVLCAGRERLPNTSAIAFPGRLAEELVMSLDLAGVAVSAGAACTAGSMDVSPVVQALHLDDATARSVVRISWGPDQTEACAEAIAARILAAVHRT